MAGGDGADLDLRPRPGRRRSRCGAPSHTGPSCSRRCPHDRVHARREARDRRRGRAARARRGAERRLHPDALPRRQARAVRRLPDVRRRRRGLAAAAARLRDARHRRDGRLHQLERAAAPEDADGDAPLRAPERGSGRAPERARRPRRGAGRGGAADPPGREARAVRRPQPADGLRAGHLHPLQPLRPLHAGGDAVLGALARGPRAGGADRPDLGQVVARHRVRALRRLPLDLPDRRDLREVPRRRRRRGARARADEDDLHLLRRRLPDRPERRPRDEADRQGHLEAGVRLERRQPLRQGPLRLQLRPSPGPADRAARPGRGRGATRRRPGSTRSRSPPTGSRG